MVTKTKPTLSVVFDHLRPELARLGGLGHASWGQAGRAGRTMKKTKWSEGTHARDSYQQNE